jgi:phosphohistidine phosphatase
MGTRRLTLLRHGHAQPAGADGEDFERPLTRRGAAEAREMAVRIVHRKLVPDLILTSPAGRAWATARVVAFACELDAKRLIRAPELYLASAESIWRLVTRRHGSPSHLLVCGHNPGLSQLASRLGPDPQPRDLGTAGLATAVWRGGAWGGLEPEAALECDLDDPESMADLWV